ncbi:MAG: hypothetical protein ACI4J7_00945, partial [Ruminiclostridium sp.]
CACRYAVDDADGGLSTVWRVQIYLHPLSLSKKLYFRLPRNRQMLGNRITARLCACRYAVDDADGGLSTV